MAQPNVAYAHGGWLEQVFDKLDVGVVSIDHTAGRVLWANEAYARILGFSSAEEAIGTSPIEHYADAKERSETEARLLASESFRKTGVARLEVQRLRRDTREPVDILLAIFATFGADGRIVRMECTLEDIGERKRVEKAFRASEERFRTIFDKSSVGMAITDLRGCLQRVNGALCRFVARSEAELLGTDALSLVHPDDRPKSPAPCAATPDGATGREMRFLRPDGEIAWGYITYSWLSDGAGAPHSSFAVIHDVSETKRLEQGLLRLAKLESLGVLAGGIAHDFNNILAVILGNVSLAKRLDDAGPRSRELLIEAENACLRARELAQQLVTFAKGGAPQKRTGSIADVVTEAAGFYLRGSNVAVDLAIGEDLWLADFDVGQMGQVMQNLLLNAQQAMPGGGTVRVEAANVEIEADRAIPVPPGRYVCIRVIDGGSGIEPEYLDRIFDPYFSTKKTGSGLGLATAHSIVLRHGGHIAVASAPGRGTSFDVYLPASEGEPAMQPRVPSASGQLPHSRVLVMDDEPAVLNIAARILRAKGLDVDLATKGEEAIAAYEAALATGQPYGIVILDLTIRGGLGGIETLERLRTLDGTVKAIVMTGYSPDIAAANVREDGFSAAVRKPFTAADLETAVREAAGGV